MGRKKKQIPVALALLRNQQGQVLITERHCSTPEQPQWEFPGGKCDPGESYYAALCRECKEELGIVVERGEFLYHYVYDYGSYLCLLDIWAVQQYQGQVVGNEGQAIAWLAPMALNDYPILSGSDPIIKLAQRSSALTD